MAEFCSVSPFQVHPRHGVQYHYYSEADAPANEGRDDVEWLTIKALVSAGLVSFGEPCIVGKLIKATFPTGSSLYSLYAFS